MQLKWNDEGTSLIVLAQTEVDRSGKSYYGETTLYLLSANGGFDSRIDLGTVYPPCQTTVSNLAQTKKGRFMMSLGRPIQKSLA